MWGWWALFWTLNFQVPVGHSSRDAPGSGMCKSEAQEWGLASFQTSWVLSSRSGQDTTAPSSALAILLQEEQLLQFGWLLSKILKRSSLKDLVWFWQGCTWVLTPLTHSQMQWELQRAEWVTGRESNSSPHTLPTSPRMGGQRPCLPLPSTKWATQTRFISPVLHSVPDRKDARNLAGHFPTLLIPDRMCIPWIPKSWPGEITSVPAKAICYSLLFKIPFSSYIST